MCHRPHPAGSRRRRAPITRLLPALLLAIPWWGCARWTIPPYGHADPDGDYRHGTIRPVTLPPNAPTIMNGYNVLPAGVPETPEDMIHEAIDVHAPKGTPVLAPAPGVVLSSYWEPLNGNNLVIDHGEGASGLFIRTRYKHLDQRRVQPGDRVERGEEIGRLGRSGLLSGGILHLHFEVRGAARHDQPFFGPLNPHQFWYDGPHAVTCFDPARTYADTPFRITYPVPCDGPGGK